MAKPPQLNPTCPIILSIRTMAAEIHNLIKLMTMVSVVFTPVVVKFSPVIQEWLHIATK